MSLATLGQKIKAKHPDYNDMSDEEVGQKILTKHPEYNDIASMPDYVPKADQGSNPVVRGIEEGGLGVLQTAENLQRGLTHKSSNFQPLIDQAKQSLPQPKSGGFIKNVGNALGEAVGQTPGLVTQVEGLGGGGFGMAAQGYYGQDKDATQNQRLVGAGTGAALGAAYNGINKLQPKVGAGGSEIIGKLLTRMGLGGALGYGSTKATGGTNEQALAQGGLGAYSGISGEKNPKGNIKLSQEATKSYRDMLNPTASQIRKLDLSSNHSVDDLARVAARERLPVESVEQGGKKKLDTSKSNEILGSKIEELNTDIQKRLDSNPNEIFDLEDIRQKSKDALSNNKANALTLDKAHKNVDLLIDAEIGRRNGNTRINGSDLNRIKSGMWNVGYDMNNTSLRDSARQIGRASREAINKGYPDASIQNVNKQEGAYLGLQDLLESAHGKNVAKGPMQSAAHIIGALGGHEIPFIGPWIGGWVGGKIADSVASPERTSASASAKSLKAGMSTPELPGMPPKVPYTPPPTKGPGPYKFGSKKITGPYEQPSSQELRKPLLSEYQLGNNPVSGPYEIPSDVSLRQNLPSEYSGGVSGDIGSYPEITLADILKPYGQEYAGKAGKITEPTPTPHEPYPDAPYKKPTMKDLAKKKAKK